MFAEGLHLFGIYQSSYFTYGVILVGVLSFLVGSLALKKVSTKQMLPKQSIVRSINFRMFFSFMGGTTAILFMPALSNFLAIVFGDLTMEGLRASFDNLYANIILRLLYNYIALPFSLACLPIVALILVGKCSSKVKTSSFLLTAFIISERIFIDAGRGILLHFFAILFFAYLMFNNAGENKLRRKQMRTLIYTVLVLVVLVYLAITLARGTSFSEFFKQIYIYVCGCVPFLDANLQIINEEQVLLFGSGGLHGPLQFIFTMLENVGIMEYPKFMQVSDTWYNNSLIVRYIGPNIQFNAYATTFYNVYLDGGIVTVFIEMLLYGAFSRYFFNIAEEQPNNDRAKAIYLFIIYGLIFSFIRFQFSLARNFLCFIFIVLIVGGKKSPHENRAN